MMLIIALLVVALVLGLAWAIFKNAAKIVAVIAVIAIGFCVWHFAIKDNLPDTGKAISSLSSASNDALESVKDSGKATLDKAKNKGKESLETGKKKASDKGTQVLNKALDSAIKIAKDMQK